MNPETPQLSGRPDTVSNLEKTVAAHKEADAAFKNSLRWSSAPLTAAEQDAVWRKSAETEGDVNRAARVVSTDNLVDHVSRDPNPSEPVKSELFYRGRPLSEKHLSTLALHPDGLVSHLAGTSTKSSPAIKALHALTHGLSCRYCKEDREY